MKQLNSKFAAKYTPNQVLDYWFAGSEHDIKQLLKRKKIWYSVSLDRDEEIKRKFSTLLQEVEKGRLQKWSETSSGVLALVLVLDQFTRQIYRKTARAFTNDAYAIEVTYTAIECGLDREMSVPGRLFFYHPFQHSERLNDQEFGVQLVRRLRSQCSQEWQEYVSESLRFFEEHCEIIRRFGRFPHRNEVLARRSTPDEIKFLQTASSYGQ